MRGVPSYIFRRGRNGATDANPILAALHFQFRNTAFVRQVNQLSDFFDVHDENGMACSRLRVPIQDPMCFPGGGTTP